MEKARQFQKNIYFSIDYTKAFDCVDHNKCGKFLKRWDYQTTLPASWETCIQVKKQQSEPDILECEVKWALETALQTQLVEVMDFQLSYFKS